MADVAAIERLLHDRARGMSLASAIERARSTQETTPSSVFDALRQRHPTLAARTLGKRAMFAISRAIEDEAFAAGESSVLVGCFQHERFYRQSERRWRELARATRTAIVFAEFTRRRTPASGPTQVSLPPSTALLREWAVVCDGLQVAGVLAGWERPQRHRAADRHRHFEAVWSADPHIVRDATLAALALAEKYGGIQQSEAAAELEPVLDDTVGALRRATSLTNRVVDYLQ